MLKEVASVGETEDLKTEAKDSIIQENLPQDAKAMTLNDDMKIIQDIKNPEATKIETPTTILETKPIEPVVEVTPSIGNNSLESSIHSLESPTMNLDSLLFDTSAPATPTTAPVEQVKNPFDLIQANTPAQQVAQPAVMTTAIAAAQVVPAKKKN